MPESVLAALAETEVATAGGTRMTLVLALNYGSRQEIVDAARSLARDAQLGRLDPDSIDEAAFAARLSTAGLPDPDLLIRTAGELRVSNYLLWQISYAELWVTERTWPEFDTGDFDQALIDFASRERRFGGLNQGGTTTC